MYRTESLIVLFSLKSSYALMRLASPVPGGSLHHRQPRTATFTPRRKLPLPLFNQMLIRAKVGGVPYRHSLPICVLWPSRGHPHDLRRVPDNGHTSSRHRFLEDSARSAGSRRSRSWGSAVARQYVRVKGTYESGWITDERRFHDDWSFWDFWEYHQQVDQLSPRSRVRTALTDDLEKLLEHCYCSTESGQADSRTASRLPASSGAFDDNPPVASG